MPSAIRGGVDLELVSDGHRGRGVEHVVAAGHVEFKRAEQGGAVATWKRESYAAFGRGEVRAR